MYSGQYTVATRSDGILEDKLRYFFHPIKKDRKKTVKKKICSKLLSSIIPTYLIATDSDFFVFN